MIRSTLSIALLAAAFGGAAQAGQPRAYTDTERAFYGVDERASAREAVHAPGQRALDQARFGSFSTANTAKTLGY